MKDPFLVGKGIAELKWSKLRDDILGSLDLSSYFSAKEECGELAESLDPPASS